MWIFYIGNFFIFWLGILSFAKFIRISHFVPDCQIFSNASTVIHHNIFTLNYYHLSHIPIISFYPIINIWASIPYHSQKGTEMYNQYIGTRKVGYWPLFLIASTATFTAMGCTYPFRLLTCQMQAYTGLGNVWLLIIVILILHIIYLGNVWQLIFNNSDSNTSYYIFTWIEWNNIHFK